jgi:tetratricopeptide (TPR) repeat protein
VTGFFAAKPAYSPENLDLVIDATYVFVKDHVQADPNEPGADLAYFFANRMPALFKLKGDEIAGMEAMFARLERDIDPVAAKYLRARYYLRGMIEAPADRAMFLTKALGALDQVQASGTGPVQRTALATLATLRLNERDFAGARADLLKYLATYPASDWAWLAEERAALAAIELGHGDQAATELNRAAAKYASIPVARVLANAYAARADEASSRFDRALAHDREALRAWDDDYGDNYSLYLRVTPRPGQFGTGSDAALVGKTALTSRVATLAASLNRPQGTVLERGRWLLAHDRRREAIDTLRPLVAGRTAVARDARLLVHGAELDEALELADADKPGADDAAARSRLEPLTREPLDFAVTAARIAEACLIGKRGDLSQAEARTGRALTEWQAQQRVDEPSTPLERDVAEIRRAVFLPSGGGVYGSAHWNAFDWASAGRPPFAIVNPAVRVKLPGGEIVSVALQQSFDVDRKVLFLPDEDLDLLRYVLAKLGGSKRRVPRAIMETPNQPVGASMDILALWNKFFPARPGHWGGWELETYPKITQIEFTDAGRTKAEAAVTIGYSGATVVLEKVDGRWIARRLTNQWIT